MNYNEKCLFKKIGVFVEGEVELGARTLFKTGSNSTLDELLHWISMKYISGRSETMMNVAVSVSNLTEPLRV